MATTWTASSAPRGVEDAIAVFRGRWKLLIVFQLFGGNVKRTTELRRAVRGISQKVLTQQLRQLERDGVVVRTVHAAIPPRVDYRLTGWGQAMCPAIEGLLDWLDARPEPGSARSNG